MTWSLVVSSVGFYVLLWRLPASSITAVEALLGLQPAAVMAILERLAHWQPGFAGAPAALQDAGRLLAASLGHALLLPGVIPVLVDSCFLAALGRRLERRLGSFPFLLLYLGDVLTAAAVQVAVDPRSSAIHIGASGGVSAVVGAYLVACARARVTMLVPVVVVPAILHLPVIAVALAWFVLQFPTIKQLLAVTGAEPLGWLANGGGFALGLLAGPLGWRRRRAVRSSRPAQALASPASTVRIDR